MQVFIIGTPFETAKSLDKKRLNKQIIECKQILKAIDGESNINWYYDNNENKFIYYENGKRINNISI